MAPKERPILFSAPMVRAILDGSKTQTRRVVKLKPHHQIEERDDGSNWPWMYDGERDTDHWIACPYGQPGDRLWAREAWQYGDWTEDGYPFITYQADGVTKLRDRIPSEWSPRLLDIWAELSEEKNYAIDGRAADRRWRPSIHMPRWASRITLEVTGVRVERLQDISEADAAAEGCGMLKPYSDHWQHRDVAKEEYRLLWESINGLGSWDANPWVWVVEFRRLPC